MDKEGLIEMWSWGQGDNYFESSLFNSLLELLVLRQIAVRHCLPILLLRIPHLDRGM